MAFLPREGAEPIAGYQLVQRLGTGGYGEVWKAVAPGGLTKAIKIVYGHIQETRAEQELKALSRIREVRHPFLLSLERFEIIDGQLFIVTELADMSLLDRFHQCQKAGHRGIPRDELLNYLRDASDALDYLSAHFGLQHQDVKPQNMLLVGGRIKIADFGQVKELRGTSVTATGGVTPVYAPPEAFDGRVSRFSDQYSLAIVYQEMLTGVRPFPGTTALQLASQHTSSPPVLDPLPAQDRPAVARALAKIPDRRFPTCRDMVENLLRPSAAGAEFRAFTEPPPAPVPGAPAAPGEPGAAVADEDLLDRVTEISPVIVPAPVPTPVVEAAPGKITVGPAPKSPSLVQLRPTLYLGVGGLAGLALRRLKQRLQLRFENLADVPALALLHLDTDRAALQQVRREDAGGGLTADETLLVPLRRPEDYRPQSKDLLRWLDRRWLYGIPRSLLTEGIRPLGRLALVDNLGEVLPRLRETLARLTSPEALAATEKAAGIALRDTTPRVFLVASISGGTGGGMVLDLAYAVRQTLAELGRSAEGVCALLIHATGQKPAERDLARIDAYATLKELAQFGGPEAAYPGDAVHGLAPGKPGEPPFQDCYLVHLGEHKPEAEFDAATDLLAQYLYLDATSAGISLDRLRQGSGDPALGTCLRTFGLDRISFPRHRLAGLMARLFCSYVVDGWRGAFGDRGEPRMEMGPLPEVCAAGLDAEALANKLVNAAQDHLGEDPEAYFQRLAAVSPELQPSAADGAPATGPQLGPLLGRLNDLVFARPEEEQRLGPKDTALEAPLRERAQKLIRHLGGALVEWLRQMVDDPKRRLKAAERAARWLQQNLASAGEIAQAQRAELRGQADALRRQLLSEEPVKKGSGARWLGLKRGSPGGPDPRQAVAAYGRAKLGELAFAQAHEVLQGLTKRVIAFTQDCSLCRQKLGQFVDRFRADFAELAEEMAHPEPIPHLTELLPGQAKTLGKAAEEVANQVGPALLRPFDEAFQAEVLDPQGGLWHLVVEDGSTAGRLKDELEGRARRAILEALGETDAARLFLEAEEETTRAGRALATHVRGASPQLTVPGSRFHLVLGVPSNASGVAVRDLVVHACPGVPMTVFDSEGDVVLCLEAANLSLAQAATTLAGEDEAAYAEIARRMVTRVDVAWSGLLAQPV